MRVGVVLLCGMVLLSSCTKRRSTQGTEIRLQLLPVGKVYLNPNTDDKVVWVDASGTKTPVDFLFNATPCAEGPKVSECTINVAKGNFKYSCSHCIDPGVAVGSTNVAISDLKPRSNKASSANPPDPFVYCKQDQTAAAQDVTASVGDTIEWLGAGAIAAWTVTPVPNTCVEAGPFNAGNPICTIKAGATSSSYKVNVPACTANPNGSAQLTIR